MKAVDLKVGMVLSTGEVVESVDIVENEVEICLSCIDYDCGEVEYNPMVVSIDEEFELE